MIRWILVTVFFLGVFLVLCKNLYAFDNTATHPALTDKAILASQIDDYLKTQLGLVQGIKTGLKYYPTNLLWWVKNGSGLEDEPTIYALTRLRSP